MGLHRLSLSLERDRLCGVTSASEQSKKDEFQFQQNSKQMPELSQSGSLSDHHALLEMTLLTFHTATLASLLLTVQGTPILLRLYVIMAIIILTALCVDDANILIIQILIHNIYLICFVIFCNDQFVTLG